MKIQRVEIRKSFDEGIFCPFCGLRVLAQSNSEDEPLEAQPCEHTLFVAHDEGFEYRSKKFNQFFKIKLSLDEFMEPPEGGVDEFTDKMEIEDGVKFAYYAGPPAMFGLYIGFAPLTV